MIKRTILHIAFFIVGSVAFSQPDFPQREPVFNDTLIPRIDILIDPDSLAAIFDDVTSYHEYTATFVFQAGDISDTVYQVGFRLRGNTSRYSPKKSFKVSFNTFLSEQKFYGLEKLNINGEHNDPSVIRSKLCWDILSDFILIWTDGQNNQGSLHANFRLNKSGEEIGIFESPDRNSLLIDYLAFGIQTDDISYGRNTDGGTSWIFYSVSTPGYSNTLKQPYS